MAASEARMCPNCGSAETTTFADGSGTCRSCGRAFRGWTESRDGLKGLDIDVGQSGAKPREPERLGLLGVLGGVLGYAGIPSLFLIGSVVSRQDPSAYVANLINTPRAAVTCGGLALLIVAATYGVWAGSWVWRGYTDKSFHLIVAGALGTVAGTVAGPGLHGIVGILGGLLVLVMGLLAFRKTRTEEETSHEGPEALSPEL